MSNINWLGIDLNLLLTFEAMLKHRSVSRAAESLFIGQSAMSYNLNRLRKLLNDPLFERQGNIMVPTFRAEELSTKVNSVLSVIKEEILFPQDFDPALSHERIIIGLSDYAELVFGPVLYDQLIAEAPDAKIVFQAIDSKNCCDALMQGNTDLAIGVFNRLSDNLSRVTLYRERHVCLFDNSVLKVDLPISLDDYLATPQAMVTATGELSSPVDKTLEKINKQRRVVLGSSPFLTLRHLLTGRRLLSVMAEMMGRTEIFMDQLVMCKPPIPIDDFNIEMVFRHRDEHHPRMQWLTHRVKSIIQEHLQVLRNQPTS